ncbi:DDE-type integrase/transposase/recombinase [Lysinibacillus sp. BW-2-10]|uniref:Mu transposase domain-containing protein n=1 Tax=Lysinibacillus sp. BW-2-10 TaxID=2590030 RepID=UPI00117F01B4|nr:DDE-type integrase/transposase/recombinase [Lysinibacillus sp. BW-2-10]TSI07372.1 transposase family protein [Lysinibacillus sp. BW-2-10]
MTLSLHTISKIQSMTFHGLSQRAIAAIIGHTVASVNKYSKLLRYYTQDKLRLSQYYCRCLLTQNAHLTIEEFENFLKQELKLSLKKRQIKAIFEEEKIRLYIKHLDLCYKPGEAAQFDWGTIQLTIAGEKKRICLAVFSFPYSNYRFYYATASMNRESFLEAFQAFIIHLGAVPPVLIIDNMRIAIQYTDGKRNLTSLFQQLEQHYGMTIKPCTPHRPNQKGNVENAVRTIKTHLNATVTYNTYKQLTKHIKQWNKTRNEQPHHEKNDRIRNLHQHEKTALLPIPKKSFVYYESKQCKVTKNGTIRFQTNTYSVPEQYSGLVVEVSHSKTTIYVKNKAGDIIAKYCKDNKKRKRHYRIWHMLHKIKAKAAGFVNSHEYQQLPKHLRLLHDKLCEKHTHFFIEILESFEHEPAKKLKHFIYTLLQEKVTFEQLKQHLKLE